MWLTLVCRFVLCRKEALPFLTYDNSDTLRSIALQQLYSLDSSLSMVLAVYTFNGTFLGLEPLNDQLQLCGGDPQDTNKFLRVGTS